MENTKTTSKKSFVESFKSISYNLELRYNVNMHLDFINEFIKFADNTRDADLMNSILDIIHDAQDSILNLINNYEHENKHKEDID